MSLYSKVWAANPVLTDLLRKQALPEHSSQPVEILAGDTENRQILIGMILAASVTGEATADAGNSGDGTVSAISPGSHYQTGLYRLVARDATTFDLYAPGGALVGVCGTGTNSCLHLDLTITAGGEAFVAGDGFDITLTAGPSVALDPAGTDGAQIATALALENRTISTGSNSRITGLVCGPALCLTSGLIWPGGITDADKAKAIARLERSGIHFE